MKFDNIIKDDMKKEAEGGNGGNKWEMVKNLPHSPYFWPIHNHEGKCGLRHFFFPSPRLLLPIDILTQDQLPSIQ